jgi:integrase/recombinase XerC
MSKQSISKRVKKIGYIVGLGDFRPHCIRKTRLNQIGQQDIQLAKQMANHESIDTTARFYMEKQDQSEVLEKVDELLEKAE